MKLDELKVLWIEDGNYSPKKASDIMADLAPELIALWEAVAKLKMMSRIEDYAPDLGAAIEALNAKLERMG